MSRLPYDILPLDALSKVKLYYLSDAFKIH